MKIFNVQTKLADFHFSIENLEIEQNKIHALIGANGSGKSTFAKVIMQMISLEKGNIDYQGLQYQDIILASQKPYLLRDTVFENIIYPLKIRHYPINIEEVDYYLNLFGIFDKKNVYARQLSSGQQQKISIIRTVIAKPKCIIFDETLSNLDIESISIVKNIIQNLHEKEKICFILISHQLSSISNLVDKYHFFAKGKHIISCDLQELVNSPLESVKQYMALQSFV